MNIHHRGVYHDRLDAPFVGSLIFAADCHHHCRGCCHEDRHTKELLCTDSEVIIQEVLDYKFSQGIILGGFEWTEQPDELMDLVDKAYSKGLQIILYTHHTKEDLQRILPWIYKYKGIYIKYGEYREDLRTTGHVMYGVTLATSNQYIEKVE